MKTGKGKLWYISTFNLFKELSEDDKAVMMPQLREFEIARKHLVYAAGEESGTVYILKEGKIKITRLLENGKELTVDILGPGDIFGESAMSDEGERTSSAEAMEDASICAMSKKDFEEFLATRPHFAFRITKWMGIRKQRIENRLENVLFQDVPERLMTTLRELAERFGAPAGGGGTRISIRLSHQELANLIGASRETVTLEINNLRKSGELLLDGRDFILPAR